MELHLKAKKRKKQEIFSKFQSILMQVAKSGIISRNTAARKISKFQKNSLNNQFEVDCTIKFNLYLN